MSYLVLARKYRPRNFTEMVGQEHVLTALTNALDHQRLHHSYIFSGTRGVGKTTIARIFAKCLNNPDGISATPDETTAMAQAIDKGQFIDLIEVDAASRTKVEQTRELLENVAYPPTEGRFKIYLIDEAHQLSTSSFNALLKTLEEPPEFVKFLFATTEPQKLPITIMSRSLQFNLRAIPEDLISQQLSKVLASENISFDQEAVHLLAKAGRGSMRDALSITDQAIAHTNAQLRGQEIAVFLGMLDQSRLEQLVALLLESKTATLLELLREQASFSPNYDTLIEQLLALLQQAAIEQFAKQTPSSPPMVKHIAAELSAETIQLYYQMLLRGKAELAQLDNRDMGFAMLMLRLIAFTPTKDPTVLQAEPKPNTAPAMSAPLTTTTSKPASSDNSSSNSHPDLAPPPATDQTKSHTQAKGGYPKLPLPRSNDDWCTLFAQLDIEGYPRLLAGNTSFSNCDDQGNLLLNLGAMHYKMMNKEYHAQIVRSIEACVNAPFRLRYNKTEQQPTDCPLSRKKLEDTDQEAQHKQLLNDPEISKLIQDFDGTITNVTTPYSPHS